MELLEWDARTYESLPLPHQQWGPSAIARLRLRGDETVLDLGCGTGRDAQHLLTRLPRGRVVAVDGSQQMLDELRVQHAAYLDRIDVVHADIRAGLPSMQVDAALSVATLHWLPDHQAIFDNVAAVLRPGGQFVAEAGGHGNIVNVRQALTAIRADDGGANWNFATIADTQQRLAAAGFTDIDVALVPHPARLEPGEQFEAFLATVVLGAHLRELRPQQRRPFVHSVATHMAEPVVDYVRLQIKAVRG